MELEHRASIGGMWDIIGKHQFDFLVKEGLKPSMKLLDLGCGCLRGGVHFINYLNADNYFGIDVDPNIINAGYELELNHSLREKCSRNNLLSNSDFQANLFNVEFDFVLAQSVFTHLPKNCLRECLTALSNCVAPNGKFYATFFICLETVVFEDPIVHQPGGIVTYWDRDPYHYRIQDIVEAVEGLPWSFDYYGDWHHPRNQKMAVFTKKPDLELLNSKLELEREASQSQSIQVNPERSPSRLQQVQADLERSRDRLEQIKLGLERSKPS